MGQTIFGQFVFSDLMADIRSELAVGMATAVLLLYILIVLLGFPSAIAASLLIFSLVVVLVMILVILTDERRSQKTFDEYFYEDMEMKRNVSDAVQ
jgi:ABC-type transport system involved in cytochrome bd biosynthesis fused ATPase/permease subunit